MLSELTTLQGHKRTHVTMVCFVRIGFITSILTHSRTSSFGRELVCRAEGHGAGLTLVTLRVLK